MEICRENCEGKTRETVRENQRETACHACLSIYRAIFARADCRVQSSCVCDKKGKRKIDMKKRKRKGKFRVPPKSRL